MKNNVSLKSFEESPYCREILFSWSKKLKTISLSYEVINANNVLWPSPQESQRSYNLWKHTCFELFLMKENLAGYLELNFSPSLEWDAYHFTSYRKPKTLVRFKEVNVELKVTENQLQVELELPNDWINSNLKASPTAVIETIDNQIQYFAYKHSSKPDFHDSNTFILNFD